MKPGGTAPLNNPLAPAWRLRKVRPRSKTPQLRSLPSTLLRHRRPQDRPLPKSRRLRSFFPRIHLSVDSRKRPPLPQPKTTRPRKRPRTQLNNQRPQLFIRYNRRTTTRPRKSVPEDLSAGNLKTRHRTIPLYERYVGRDIL